MPVDRHANVDGCVLNNDSQNDSGSRCRLHEYYERRATNPSVAFVQAAALALDVTPGELLNEPDTKTEKAAKVGRPSRLEERLGEAKKLPRKKQEQLARMIDAFLDAERRSA